MALITTAGGLASHSVSVDDDQATGRGPIWSRRGRRSSRERLTGNHKVVHSRNVALSDG
jgi:hypothetical protein